MAVTKKFAVYVKAAATAGFTSINKNALPQRELLEKAARFEVRNEPVVLATYNQQLFVASSAVFGTALKAEYHQYIADHASKSFEVWQAANNHAYWASKLEVRPRLASLAIKWAQIPMSSIAAQCVFAQARVVDAPHRKGQIWPTFTTEDFVRINEHIVEDLASTFKTSNESPTLIICVSLQQNMTRIRANRVMVRSKPIKPIKAYQSLLKALKSL